MSDAGIKDLYDKITEAKYLTAFTGAGISTLSGIRDFRGKDGLYNDPSLSKYAEKMFDIEYFKKDPSLYYKSASSLKYNLHDTEASIVHIVLAELEKKSILKAIITQNIDMLHQKAGSTKVIEVHGSPRVYYCLKCSDVSMSYDAAAEIIAIGEMPRCPKCEAVLKPAITFFGESLPEDALREAGEEAEKSDLMLVLGSSLTVYPAASIPQLCLRNGGDVIIVNNMETAIDKYAVLCFDDLGETFSKLKDFL